MVLRHIELGVFSWLFTLPRLSCNALIYIYVFACLPSSGLMTAAGYWICTANSIPTKKWIVKDGQQLPLLIGGQVIEIYCQILFYLRKLRPEKYFFARAFVQSPKDTTFHYHVEDLWALNMAIYG